MTIMSKALAVSQPNIQRRFLEHLKRVSYRAKCFLFDHDSSRLIGQFAHECTDLILDHRQFAKPPYDVTYIEYDNKGLQTGLRGGQVMDWEDIRTGFLVYLSTVYVFVSANERLGTPDLVWPIFYYCAERGTKVDHKSIFPVLDYGKWPMVCKLALIMGSGLSFMLPKTVGRKNAERSWHPDELDKFDAMAEDALELLIAKGHKDGLMLRELCDSNEAYWAGKKETDMFQAASMTESVGDLRKLWAGLLWLQSMPKSVKFSEVPASATLYHGKRVALSAHSTVHIHLRGTKTIRQRYMAVNAKRNSPRRHDVRGHHKHRGGAVVGCSHVWPPTPNEKGQFICEKCQRKRWFVKAFQRGDETKGFVDKDYKMEV